MSRGSRARVELLDAAERLIAEHGFDVPLRDIAIAAGQRNNSAVNYYFRNRQDLIDAVVARRLAPMEVEREEMLAALPDERTADVRTLLQVMVLPLLNLDSSHYRRFLQVVRLRLRTEPQDSSESAWPRTLKALSALVPTSDRSARRRRVEAVAIAMFALAADYERHIQEGTAPADPGEEIVTMLAAMLVAPVSTAAVMSR